MICAHFSTSMGSVAGGIAGCQAYMYVERGMMRIKSTFTMSPAFITLIPLGKATLTCYVDFKNTCYRGFPGGPGRTHVWCGGTSMGRSHAGGQLSPCPAVTAPTHLEHASRSRCSPCREARGLAPRFRSPCSAAGESRSPAVETQRSPKRYLLQPHFRVSLWANSSVFHIYCLTYGKAQDFLSALVPLLNKKITCKIKKNKD